MTLKDKNHEMKKSPLNIGDKVNDVFFSEKKVYRCINKPFESTTLKLMKCGLIDELIKNKYIPPTKVSQITIPNYSLVIEQDKIDPIIYPYEWSPEMLRKAALVTLNINKLARKYNLELKDAQPFNIVFDHLNPMHVDIGSFTEIEDENRWRAENEFLTCYYGTLKLVEKKMINSFKLSFSNSGNSFKDIEIELHTNKIYNILGYRLSKRIIKITSFMRSTSRLKKDIISKRKSIFLKAILRKLGDLKKNTNYTILESKINDLNITNKSRWGDYHVESSFYNERNEIVLSNRMHTVIEKIEALDPLKLLTILEIAGNQGALSRVLAKKNLSPRVICSDYDMQAVDKLVNSPNTEKVFPACFDFMGDAKELLSGERASRLKSDLIIALAVTHHLVLSQNYSLSSILLNLSKYTNRYVIIEYMPLGLWNGSSAAKTPEWYTEEWFMKEVSLYFNIIEKTKTEKNRILVIGEKLLP